MQTFEEFINDKDDRYGPGTEEVREQIRKWLDRENIEFQLNLKACNIHTLPPLPCIVKNLVIGNKHLVYLPITSIPLALTGLTCTNCDNVRRIPPLPKTIRYVNFSHSGISDLSQTTISKVPYLYTGLQELGIAGTNVSRLPCFKLPSTLFTLDISGTKIKKLPKLNRGLKTLNISNTLIAVLPRMPLSLINLYVYACSELKIQRETDGPMHVMAVESIQMYGEKWDKWHNQHEEVTRSLDRCARIRNELINYVWQKPSSYELEGDIMT